MFERRAQTRFHPGSSLSVILNPVLAGSHKEISGRVEDVSCRGFLAVFPENDCRRLNDGQTVSGELRCEDSIRAWTGTISHMNSRSGGTGVGVILNSPSEEPAPLKETVEQVVQNPRTGGINLRRQDEQLILEVVGHLSLPLSRDFLHLVRQGSISAINLSQCKGMDSAGLGMLCIATDGHIPLLGAQGIIKELLEVARIPMTPTPKTPLLTPGAPKDPIKATAPEGSGLVKPRTTPGHTSPPPGSQAE